jgi:porphobilinogen synthase
MRRAAWSRRLVGSTADHGRPHPAGLHRGRRGPERARDVDAGIERHSPDRLLAVVERALELGIPAIALFPATPHDCKSEGGDEAWNPENLTCRTIR